MNFDCQLIIFEFLPVYDLLLFAEINKKLKLLVERELKRRFLKKMLIFRAPYDSHELKDARASLKESYDLIQITRLPTIYMILRDFGHTIANLKILHFLATPEHEDQSIYQSINLYGSESLSQFHITNNGNDIFARVTKPFKTVERLSLHGRFKNVNNSEFGFEELFPWLRQLDLESVNIHELDISERKMAHLEYLTADIWNSNTSPAIKRLITNNPQIRSLTLLSVTPGLLQFVSERLPHLQYLEIGYFSEENVDVTNFRLDFKELKSFILCGTSSVYTIPSNIIFRDIEELEANAIGRDSARLIEISLKYKKNLEKLRLIVALNNEEILQLANAELNVVEMAFTCGKNCDKENVVKLIESCKQLKQFRLHIDPHINHYENFSQMAFEALQTLLSDEWIITKTENCIHLKRELEVF